ncbi:MAG: HAD family hydrolase [Cyanobacteriota bacterium]|nr:HAD family hydrolase [Cyanobacteriota bacterium]
MSLKPVADLSDNKALSNLRLVASDMDGTLTKNGKFTPALLRSLEKLSAANIQVLIITGRSAGWVQAIKNYLPVIGAIAENGGLFFPSMREEPEFLTQMENLTLYRQQLAETFQYLKSQFPDLIESGDNRFRLTDWTFDVLGLSNSDLETIEELCREQNYGFTYSNVQCHIKPLEQDKATGLMQVLSQYFPQWEAEQIITVGDSPNDESLFDKSKFSLSVGVANIMDYADKLRHRPVYVTKNKEVEGFCELVEVLLMGHP